MNQTVEFEFASLDLVQDLILRAASEGRVPAKQDIEDDPTRPDITFFVVVCKQHFWSNIVWLN